jgi:uncharacterized protein with HEPN domain
MRNDDLTRLRHMIEAAQKALQFAENRKCSDLSEDQVLSFALVRAIEIIGEAASRISPEFRDRYSQIPWAAIVGMRNKLVHAYFEIDLDLVWRSTINELPPLIESLVKILASESDN